MTEKLKDLISVSREYGSSPKWVVAGGGNTSLKTEEILYVKASGFPLADIDEDGFARMDRSRLAAIWKTNYPTGEDSESVAEREKMVLADMMAARMPGEERRPSVETLLHDLLPWPLIVHLHPTLVNGLTCGFQGKTIAGKIFGENQEWIPVTNPGYVLAMVIKDFLENRSARGKDAPDYIFLANHGVFVGGHDSDDIKKKYNNLNRILEDRLVRQPKEMPTESTISESGEVLKRIVMNFFGKHSKTIFVRGGELDRYLSGQDVAVALTGALTPDHIVYSGPGALYLEPDSSPGEWKSAVQCYVTCWGKPPHIILLGGDSDGSGALVAASGEKSLDNALLLLKNALEVAAFAESFGGPQVLEERFTRFIVDWEVESFRSGAIISR